jgi:hypothetical protein
MWRSNSGEILAALILIGLGLLFLAGNLGLLVLNWNLLWPLILIFFGLWLIWRALFPPPKHRSGNVSWGVGSYRPDLVGKEIRRAEFSHGMGDFDLDLTNVIFPEGENVVHASHGLGDLTVIVPRDLAVRVQARAGMGDVFVLGKRSEGIGPSVEFQSDDYTSVPRKLNIEANVGMGKVQVIHSSYSRSGG